MMTPAQRQQAELAEAMKRKRTEIGKAVPDDPEDLPYHKRLCCSFNTHNIDPFKGSGKHYGGYGN